LVLCFTYHIDYDNHILTKGEIEMTKEVTTTKQTSMTNVDISPVITEVIEYAKDQAVITDIKTVLASIPKSSSMDWKLVSGVIMNSLVEWVVENKDNDDVKSLDLIKHLQKDIGYLLQRLGLAE
jgi:hypothetical protein|tara:strand:- start:178 stop:549 length:372 start_codon:yes stop_codon:yes gene_type:complete